VDELYLFITKKIIFPLIGQPIVWIDKNIVDGLMNLLASITTKISELASKGFNPVKCRGTPCAFLVV
jgi:hypothetical protein